jgi:hypothetical protein
MAEHHRRPITLLDLPAIRFPLEHPLARELGGDYWLRLGHKLAKPVTLEQARRGIRSRAIEITEAMSPRVHGIVREALRILGIALPFELYQTAGGYSSRSNATVVEQVEETILITTVGQILNDLDDDCLLAVMGHEVGHHIAHGRRAHGTVRYDVLLDMCGRSLSSRTARAAPAFMMSAEITADRFGLLACQDIETALRVEMLLTAGLDSAALNWVTQGYLAQCQEQMEVLLEKGETVCGFTHPEHSFRAYAVWLFSESDVYARLTGQGPGFCSIDSVNATLRRLLMPKGLVLKAPDDTPPPLRRRSSRITRTRLSRSLAPSRRTRPPPPK